MKVRRLLVLTAMALVMANTSCQNKNGNPTAEQQEQTEPTTPNMENTSKVYFTSEISPEALIKIYKALGVEAEGRVAVKISTGEAGNNNHLKADLIGPLVQLVNGKIVECNTAYAGKRMLTEDHLKVIEEHGFNTIGGVDIMDADGEIKIPVRDTSYMRYNIVGKNIENYDFMINLAHFKGHQMGGFGGVLKNASIGVASPISTPTANARITPIFGITSSPRTRTNSSNAWPMPLLLYTTISRARFSISML